MNEPSITVDLVTERQGSKSYQVVTYTVTGEDQPFFKYPYKSLEGKEYVVSEAVVQAFKAGMAYVEKQQALAKVIISILFLITVRSSYDEK